MMRFIRWTLLTVVLLIVLILSLVVTILWTEAGTGFTLQQAQKFVPGLTIGQTRGALIGRFELSEVNFDNPVVKLKLDRLELGIDNSCWLQKKICLDHLRVGGLEFTLLPSDSSEPEPEPEPSEESGPLALPIDIIIGEIDLADVHLKIFEQVYAWQDLHLDGATLTSKEQGMLLTIAPLRLSDWVVSIPPAPAEEAGDASSEDASAEDAAADEESSKSDTAVTGGEETAAETGVILPTVEIPLEIDITQILIQRGQIKQLPVELPEPITIAQLSLSGNVHKSSIKVPELLLRSNYLDLDGVAGIKLVNSYPLEAELKSTIYQFGLDGQRLALNAKGDLEELNVQAELDGVQKARLEGLIQPLVKDFPFDVNLASSHLQWPLQGKADYLLQKTSLGASGSLAGYQVDLAGSLSGEVIPAMDIEIKGQGDLSQATVKTLRIKGLNGEVNGQLAGQWSPELKATTKLQFSNLHPEMVPQLKPAEEGEKPLIYGKLNGLIEANASFIGSRWAVNLPKLAIDGELIDLPVTLAGAYDISGTGSDFSMRAKQLTLKHGPNGLIADGELARQWDMQVKIDAPSLEQSVPGLFGLIQGDIALTGKAAEPRMDVDLEVRKIRWQDTAELSQLDLKGNLTPMPRLSADLLLEAEGGRFSTVHLDDLSLGLEGNESDHKLLLDLSGFAIIPAAKGEPDSEETRLEFGTNIDLGGSLDRSSGWQGKINSAQLQSPFGTWVVDRVTELGFLFDPMTIQVAKHCWDEGKTSLCLLEDMNLTDQGTIKARLSDLNLNRFKPMLPEGTRLRGVANLDADVALLPEQLPQLDVKLALDQGGVNQAVGDAALNINWKEIVLGAELKGNDLDANWLIDLDREGVLKGEIALSDLPGTTMISGRSQIDALTLNFLRSLLADIATVNGEINSDIQIAGPLTLPELTGELTLGDLNVKLEDAPLGVQQGVLGLTFEGKQAVIDGNIQAAEGTITLTGGIDWNDPANWGLALKILSDQLQVDVPPLIALQVNTDLDLSMSPEKTSLSGTVDIPTGQITADELPVSATGISDDLVLLDENLQPLEEETSEPILIESNIKVNIGDDVSLSAFGLNAMLAGAIELNQAGAVPRMSGEINIIDGTYRSFGQQLIIDKGLIIFNGPADQPFLSIEAIRDPEKIEDNVTAGIRVTGPADAPAIEIFSEPSMAQPNALSYLLRGRNLDSESGSNNSAVSMALLGLGLASSGKLVGELGSAVGIEGLTVDTGGSGDDSSVEVSGYILPGLQVTYGVGVFNAVGALTIRYELLKNLYAVAESSVHSAVDLIYEFELQ